MISASNITLRFGGKTLFEGISFRIGPKERIGLVGSNGAGKSTLLRMLLGEQSPERGELSMAKYVSVGYLPQEGMSVAGKTLYEEASVERVILADSAILADYLLAKTADLVERLVVYPERMRRNFEMTRGLVFSGQLLLDLAAAGMLREKAYRLVQGHAMKAWEEESDFRAAIEADPEIRTVLDPAQIAETFSLERQLRNVGKIFERVFP